jgi:hypothetical protein
MYRLTAADHSFGGEVDGERAQGDRWLVAFRSCAMEGYAQAGEQLVHAEGLGEVVVGAGVEGGHLVLSCGQHDDWSLGPAAQSVDDVDAVDVGQAEVEDDQVGWPPSGQGGAVVPSAAVWTSYRRARRLIASARRS